MEPRTCARCDGPIPDAEPGWWCKPCRLNPFPEDELCRRFGYRIWVRRHGCVRWLKDGKLHTHADALAFSRFAAKGGMSDGR